MCHSRIGVLFTFLAAAAAWADEAPAPKAKDPPELHLVSIYEGATNTGAQIHGPRAPVTVNRPGKRVTLVLTSYSPVTWEITAGPDTRIEKVILGGGNPQAVKGLPESVPVVEAIRGKVATPLPYAYRIDSVGFRHLVRQVARLADQPIASFNGAYRSSTDKPFVVDRIDDDPRLSADHPRPTPADQLPKLEFKALHLTPTDRFRVRAAYGAFSLAGPKLEALRPLPTAVSRLAVDLDEGKYYGLTGHEVVEVDLAKQTTTKMDVGLGVPPLSWPCGIAFDTKRRRLLVATLDGVGYLYAYSPKTGQWSVLGDLKNMDLSALAYDPKEDSLYGLMEGRDGGGEGGLPVLCRFNAEGALLQAIRLGEPMFPGVLGRSAVSRVPPQIIPAEGHLVILATTGGEGSEQVESESFLFLVDPKGEKVRLTWKK